MKESTLLAMKNQLNSVTVTQQEILRELFQIRELAVGTMELIKKFEGYEDALEKLKEDIKENGEELSESDSE